VRLRRDLARLTLAAALAIALVLTACSSKEDAVEYRGVTEVGQFTLRLPVAWQTAPGPQPAANDQSSLGTFVLTANNGDPKAEDAGMIFIVRDDLTNQSMDKLAQAWSTDERILWSTFDGFDPTEIDGQTVLQGEGQARTLIGQKFDNMVAIYNHPARPAEAWILNCQSPTPMPSEVKGICGTAIESFRIAMP